MKKILLALGLILPMVLAGCSSKSDIQNRAEAHIDDWLTKMETDDGLVRVKSYSNIHNLYSHKADSILIYSIDVVIDNGNTEVAMPIEFYYMVLPDDDGDLAAINLMTETGSIIKAADDMYASAPEETKKHVTREQIIDLGVFAAFQSDKVIKHSVE